MTGGGLSKYREGGRGEGGGESPACEAEGSQCRDAEFPEQLGTGAERRGGDTRWGRFQRRCSLPSHCEALPLTLTYCDGSHRRV